MASLFAISLDTAFVLVLLYLSRLGQTCTDCVSSFVFILFCRALPVKESKGKGKG